MFYSTQPPASMGGFFLLTTIRASFHEPALPEVARDALEKNSIVML
jgi:hypothetical protein